MAGDALPANDNKGPMLLASIWVFHALAVLVYFTRLCSRLTSGVGLSAPDYTITVALGAKCVSVGFATAAINHGFGRHAIYIPPKDQAAMGNQLFGVFLASTISSGFARISIACLMLQVTSSRRWRMVLWATVVLQAILIIMYYVVELVQCHSVVSKQVDIKQTQCLSPSQIGTFNYASICIAMLSDLVCALIPIFLIKNLTRSTVEKVLTSILLASSLLASGVGIAKIYYTATFDFSSTDGFYLMVNVFFWSRLEESLIVIAACAPLLKCPIERLLKRLGSQGFQPPMRELNVIRLISDTKDTDSGCGRERSEVEHVL